MASPGLRQGATGRSRDGFLPWETRGPSNTMWSHILLQPAMHTGLGAPPGKPGEYLGTNGKRSWDWCGSALLPFLCTGRPRQDGKFESSQGNISDLVRPSQRKTRREGGFGTCKGSISSAEKIAHINVHEFVVIFMKIEIQGSVL